MIKMVCRYHYSSRSQQIRLISSTRLGEQVYDISGVGAVDAITCLRSEQRDLRRNKQVGMAAVLKNPNALWYLDLKSDYDVVLAAVRQNGLYNVAMRVARPQVQP